MFDDMGEETVAFFMVLMLAVPSVLLLCCVLEECPLTTGKHTLEDVPVFCCCYSTSDAVGQATATIICFFFALFVLFGFTSISTVWYIVWRGSYASNPDEASFSGSVPSMFSTLQTHEQGFTQFGALLQEQMHHEAGAAALGPPNFGRAFVRNALLQEQRHHVADAAAGGPPQFSPPSVHNALLQEQGHHAADAAAGGSLQFQPSIHKSAQVIVPVAKNQPSVVAGAAAHAPILVKVLKRSDAQEAVPTSASLKANIVDDESRRKTASSQASNFVRKRALRSVAR